MKCPCENCLLLAICKNKDIIRVLKDCNIIIEFFREPDSSSFTSESVNKKAVVVGKFLSYFKGRNK